MDNQNHTHDNTVKDAPHPEVKPVTPESTDHKKVDAGTGTYVVGLTHGGTGATTAAAGFTALSNGFASGKADGTIIGVTGGALSSYGTIAAGIQGRIMFQDPTGLVKVIPTPADPTGTGAAKFTYALTYVFNRTAGGVVDYTLDWLEVNNV